MAQPATKLPSQAQTPPTTTPARTPFETLRREMDRMLADFGGMPNFPLNRQGFNLDLLWPEGRTVNLAPAVDVTETDKAYEITAELPGLDDKDVEVKVANGAVTIKGEKRQEKEDRGKDYYLSERRYGSFVRSFGMPDGVDTNKIKAKFNKGVLSITLPKTAQAQSEEKTIEVKAG